MELRHLRYYVAVAEECHFGRAAARLHIAQPPLSQQIKQLEAELGVQLLTRSTRRVQLTPAGERYLDRAREILARVESAGDEARRVAAGRSGRVAIGFTGSATYELLPAVSRTLRAVLPDVEVELRGEMLTPHQVAGLRSGDLDIGVLRPPVSDADLTVRVVRRERLVVALPAGHPLAGVDRIGLADLAGDPFVTYPAHGRSVVYEAVLAACRDAGFEPSAVEVAETSTLLSLVAAGRGVALVPESVQHLQLTGATYRPLVRPEPTVELAFAHRRDDTSPLVREVLAVLDELINSDA